MNTLNEKQCCRGSALRVTAPQLAWLLLVCFLLLLPN